jgi:hypothetical protein
MGTHDAVNGAMVNVAPMLEGMKASQCNNAERGTHVAPMY